MLTNPKRGTTRKNLVSEYLDMQLSTPGAIRGFELALRKTRTALTRAMSFGNQNAIEPWELIEARSASMVPRRLIQSAWKEKIQIDRMIRKALQKRMIRLQEVEKIYRRLLAKYGSEIGRR
jgi:hypothetical protein